MEIRSQIRDAKASTSLQELEAQFDAFVAEAHRLKALYASRITLLIGAETELITHSDVDALSALLQRHAGKIEYLVGSVHHVNEIPIDFDEPTFIRALDSCRQNAGVVADTGGEETAASQASSEETATEALLERYLDAQYQLLTEIRPEVVGHMDLCRLYTPRLAFGDFPAALAKLKRNVSYACGYGALFEFNAAAFRKGWDSAYPGQDVVELVLASGGRFTISDDSHGPHAVGLNYKRLYKYMREVGIKELWYLAYNSRSDRGEGGRHLRAERLGGEWWQNEFWGKRGILAEELGEA